MYNNLCESYFIMVLSSWSSVFWGYSTCWTATLCILTVYLNWALRNNVLCVLSYNKGLSYGAAASLVRLVLLPLSVLMSLLSHTVTGRFLSYRATTHSDSAGGFSSPHRRQLCVCASVCWKILFLVAANFLPKPFAFLSPRLFSWGGRNSVLHSGCNLNQLSDSVQVPLILMVEKIVLQNELLEDLKNGCFYWICTIYFSQSDISVCPHRGTHCVISFTDNSLPLTADTVQMILRLFVFSKEVCTVVFAQLSSRNLRCVEQREMIPYSITWKCHI